MPARSTIDLHVADAAGLPRDVLARWPARYTATDIVALHQAGITPDRAHGWPAHLTGQSIVTLETAVPAGLIVPADIAGWPERFDGPDLIQLLTCGITPDRARQYGRQHNGNAIRTLHEHRIGPQAAAQYPTWMFATQIVVASQATISGAACQAAAAWRGASDPGCRDLDDQVSFQQAVFGQLLHAADVRALCPPLRPYIPGAPPPPN